MKGVKVTKTDGSTSGCPGKSTESVVVTVSYDYTLITPLGVILNIFGSGPPYKISLTSKADMRLE